MLLPCCRCEVNATLPLFVPGYSGLEAAYTSYNTSSPLDPGSCLLSYLSEQTADMPLTTIGGPGIKYWSGVSQEYWS